MYFDAAVLLADPVPPSPWIYRGFPLITPDSAFGPMAGFVSLWRSKWRGARSFPAWRDFDLMDFEGWWGQISLAEIHDEPFDLRWTLWGTAITEWWGADYTGKFISDLPAVQDVWHNYEAPFLERLIQDRAIGYVSGSLAPQGRGYRTICGVDLPLQQDGRITHILSAYTLADPNFVHVPPKPAAFTF